MGKELQALFAEKVKKQAELNREKYGEQNALVLMQILPVQQGHIHETYFKSGCSEKFRIELVHLAAVLYDLYGK